MADQDFQINIRTIADTTGIRLTEQQLRSLQTAARQGNKEAINALDQLSSAAKGASSSVGSLLAGGAISAGIAGVTTLVGIAISQWQKLNAELDASAAAAARATEKMRELGVSIIETQDKLISQRRTATEPLAQSYVRLTQEIIRLKTEQDLLDLPSQGEEWQKLQKQIQDTENELERVKNKLGGPPPAPTVPFPKAKKGESQELVDEMERNRRAAEEQLKEDIWEFDPETGGYKPSGKKQFPIFQPPPLPPLTNPPPNENMNANPISNDAKLERIAAGIETLLTLWR